MAKVCTRCKTQADESAKFCPQCGEKLTEMARYCPSCGVEVREGDKFCRSCGSSLHYGENKTEQVVRTEKPSIAVVRRKNPWVAAVLNFFLPGVGFMYLEEGVFILTGILIFLEMLVSTISDISSWLEPSTIVLSLIYAIGLAVAGYLGAEYINKRKQLRVKEPT